MIIRLFLALTLVIGSSFYVCAQSDGKKTKDSSSNIFDTSVKKDNVAPGDWTSKTAPVTSDPAQQELLKKLKKQK